MIVAGLTGSIAMGKTETAKMFRAFGVPVFDADACVHKLYEPEGAALDAISKRFPGACIQGGIDRSLLAKLVLHDPSALADLESIVHPLVWEKERKFLDEQRKAGAPLVIVDNPLLFEKQRHHRVDATIVVSAPSDIQRARALERPGMTVEKLDAILARQVPDAEKRRRADFVIDTSQGLDHAGQQVAEVIKTLQNRNPKAGDARNRT